MKTKIQSLRGVTLVEIAIVLVIIGLLLGGILKGQELINNAKVRAMADRQNSLKVAWFSFIDRFQALPGDYVSASQFIPGAGDGGGDGTIGVQESPQVLQHLSGAGYLRCPQCTTASTDEKPSAKNSLQNQYGGVMAIFHDSGYYSTTGTDNSRARLMIHTGPRIPSNIIAEVDRKIDDGIANSGDLVFNSFDAPSATGHIGNDADNSATLCMSQGDKVDAVTKIAAIVNGDVYRWRHIQSNPPVEQNCGASVNI